MTGTDRRRLLVIGKSRNPRCFRGVKKLTSHLPQQQECLDDIFSEWLQDFNKDMRRQRRQILLLVDNCSAHPPTSADRLTNIKLSFLPPNTTAVIQPCDQGIIRNLKGHYRSQVVHKIIADIDSVELNANQLAKKLTVLEAIHMLTTAWKNVKQQTIANCFAKA